MTRFAMLDTQKALITYMCCQSVQYILKLVNYNGSPIRQIFKCECVSQAISKVCTSRTCCAHLTPKKHTSHIQILYFLKQRLFDTSYHRSDWNKIKTWKLHGIFWFISTQAGCAQTIFGWKRFIWKHLPNLFESTG